MRATSSGGDGISIPFGLSRGRAVFVSGLGLHARLTRACASAAVAGESGVSVFKGSRRRVRGPTDMVPLEGHAARRRVVVVRVVRSFEEVDSDALAVVSDDRDVGAVLPRVGYDEADFRDRPYRVGRARMFGDRSIGHDDPGMFASVKVVEAVVG